jgi:transcription antitermination factor NusB
VDKRTTAREMAMQALYQFDVQGEVLWECIDQFFMETCPDDTSVRHLARQWTKQTWENIGICDELISEATIKWRMSRLSAVDKSILRLSVYQLKFCADIPAKVVINEAIEIAKKFSSAQSPGFVNGVLDAVLKKLEMKI